MAAMIPNEARGWLNEIRVNFDQLAAVHVRGNSSHVEATLHGRPIRAGGGPGNGAGNGRDDDHTRLRDTARRIRDRFFR